MVNIFVISRGMNHVVGKDPIISSLICATAEENAPFSDTRLAVKYGRSRGFLYGNRTRLTPTCSLPTPADTDSSLCDFAPS